MEPGIAAASYTAEKAVEGVVAGAVAVAIPTVPLKARFYRLVSPDPSLKRHSHSVSVTKGRAYIFGGEGEAVGTTGDNAVHMVILPTDPELRNLDYQKIPASEGTPVARTGHAATVIGERIYIFGGSSPKGGSDPKVAPNSPLDEAGAVHVFHTVTKTWETLPPNQIACTSGFPAPRNYAASSSSDRPLPYPAATPTSPKGEDMMTEEAKLREVVKAQGASITATNDQRSEGYGTIFLHGGYDASGTLLRDVWAFDVSDRTWSKWADVPSSPVEEGEGGICCVENKLWRCGDGFGKMAHLGLHRAIFDDMSGVGELGISPKADGWQVHAFGVKPGYEAAERMVEEKMGKPAGVEQLYPEQRRRFGLHPITTGQGRYYIMMLMGEAGSKGALGDVWSFQVASENKSAALFKDAVRSLIGKDTGVEQWARAEVVEQTKEDGQLSYPKGLSRFGSCPGGDWNDGIVIWGGVGPGGEISGDGWVLDVQ